MTDTSERIEQLERSMRQMRLGMMALVVTVGCVATLGATQPKELDLTKLRILDGEGKPRFVLGTLPDGSAGFDGYDQDEKHRFTLATQPDGSAGFTVFDKDERARFALTTSSGGLAVFDGYDQNGKKRFAVATALDGSAGLFLYGQDEKTRFALATMPDGEASFVASDQDQNLRSRAWRGFADLRVGFTRLTHVAQEPGLLLDVGGKLVVTDEIVDLARAVDDHMVVVFPQDAVDLLVLPEPGDRARLVDDVRLPGRAARRQVEREQAHAVSRREPALPARPGVGAGHLAVMTPGG